MKKSTWKKHFLAVGLALAVSFSTMPTAVFAEECPRNPGYSHEYFDGTCKYCGDSESKLEPEKPVCNHQHTYEIIVDSTHTTEGSKKIICSDCGNTIREESCPKIAEHEFVVEVKKVDATCEEQGYTVYKCKYCDEEVKKDPVSPIGHKWDEGKPDPENKGGTVYTCLNDSNHVRREECNHPEEKWVTEQKEPTHEEKGWIKVICGDCGTVIEEHECPAYGKDHVFEELVEEMTIQPTCEEEGYLYYRCKYCDELEKKPIFPIGHKWDEGKPDSENKGWIVYTCQNDPSHIKKEECKHPANKWEIEEKKSTHEEAGWIKVTCGICGEIIEEHECPIISDDDCPDDLLQFVETVKPTCLTEGYDVYTCTKHGGTVKKNIVPATGHDWDEYTVTKPATTTEEGEETRICKNDPSHIETRAIPRLTDTGDNTGDNNNDDNGGTTGGTGGYTPPRRTTPDAEVPENDVPLVDVPEEDVPLSDSPEVEIPEEETPLADAPETTAVEEERPPLADIPKTGDAGNTLWAMLLTLSAAGALALTRKLRCEK